MDRDRVRELLDAVRRGEEGVEDALEALSRLPFVDTKHARVDTHRALRNGLPEVIYGPGKTPEQIVEIAHVLRGEGQSVLVTRVEPDAASEILGDLGVSEMRLLTNVTRTIPGIDGYGLKVVERLPLKALDELTDDGK